MEMKECSVCGENHPIDFFNWKDKSKDRRNSACRTCSRAQVRNHYLHNKKYYSDKARKFEKKRWRENVGFIMSYLATHHCVDCGESDPTILEFDHCFGKKSQSIGVMLHNCDSLESIRKEISKCQVRCCNCHRRKTAKTLGWRTKK